MNFNLRDFKIFCLHENYITYNILLVKIQNHIQILFKNNIISINERNLRLSNLYEIIIKINMLREKIVINYGNDIFINITDIKDNKYIKKILTLAHNTDNTDNTDNTHRYLLLKNYLISLYKLLHKNHKFSNKKINSIKFLLDTQLLFPLKEINSDLINFATALRGFEAMVRTHIRTRV